MTITHKAIHDRAMQDAQDRMPDFPAVSTYDNWESFISDLEDLDAYEIALECADWDWVIYYHRAMELCMAVDSATLHQAESEWHELGYADNHSDSFGLYEMAAQLAAIIVTNAIVEAIETLRDELLELANDKLIELESV